MKLAGAFVVIAFGVVKLVVVVVGKVVQVFLRAIMGAAAKLIGLAAIEFVRLGTVKPARALVGVILAAAARPPQARKILWTKAD